MQPRLIGPIRRAAPQHETAVAIAAIDIAVLVDFEPDARVTERCTAGNVVGAIALDAVTGGQDGFGRIGHGCPLAPVSAEFQPTGTALKP